MRSMCNAPHRWYEQIYSSYSVNSPHNSQHLFDIYSLTHVWWFALLTALCKWVFGDSRYILIGLFVFSICFEIHENQPEQIIKYRRIEVGSNGNSSYRGDSWLNVVGDVIANLAGMYLGAVLSTQNTIAVLTVLFGVITKVVGFSYWTDFFHFVGLSGKSPSSDRDNGGPRGA